MAARKHDDETIKAALTGRTVAAAAKILNLHERRVWEHKARLAREGWSPEHGLTLSAPTAFVMPKVTVQRNDKGEVVNTWARYSPDQERMAELIREACVAMSENLPQVEPRQAGNSYLSHLLAAYPIGDAHIGMRAWGEETQGSDWDLAIAERVQCGAMAALVDMAPACEQALIINCGDWFHADNMEGTTSRSGHILDVDGRYAKMIRVGVKVMRQCIESALMKHARVRVCNVIGNHDDTGAIWLSIALSHIYANEPRVQIDTSPAPFMYHEHGKVLIGMHHGHSCKPDRLPGVMATDQAQAWGRTEFRYWYIGHVHHQSVKEYSGVTVESFNTLTAKDAYSAWGGYRAQQNMKCIIHHAEFGEVGRHTVNPNMLKGR